MAISWGPIIAGAYTATYNSVDTGFTLEGYKYGVEWKAEMINQSDVFGDTLFDFVYRGCDAQLGFISRTFKTGSLSVFWPWGQSVSKIGQVFSASIPIGQTARNVASAFVMTVTPNTPAQATISGVPTITSITATMAILAPQTRGEILFDSKARNVPIALQLLPYESLTSGTAIHALTA